MKYDSLYSIRKAWLEAIGGDATGADSVYTLSLRILEVYKRANVQ